MDYYNTEVRQLIAELLEYIEELEMMGGYRLQDGGFKKPLLRAQRILKDANPR